MAELYVFIQFVSIVLLVLSGPFLPGNIPTLILYIVAGIVGAFALAAMRHSKIRISPKVDQEATLVTSGIYRYIRHPMYLAVLLAALGMVLNQVTLIRVCIFIVLAVDLGFKMRYEETRLQEKFASDYHAYIQRTKAIIPFIL